jgi:hypothetical protein
MEEEVLEPISNPLNAAVEIQSRQLIKISTRETAELDAMYFNWQIAPLFQKLLTF